MNEFVEKCLQEWRRLGVPDAIANEMAADLDADLTDAAADHVSPEEVLGNGIFDPPAFARSWAAARGVIPAAQVPVPGTDRRRITAIALAALAVLSAGLLLLVVFHPTARVTAVRESAFPGPGGGPHARLVFPPPGAVVQQPAGVGAPLDVLVLGLLAIALLAGGAWFVWRRT